MGMEVAGSDLVELNVEAIVEESQSKLHQTENGEVNMAQHISETIKFGLHGVDEPPNSEGKNTTSADFPKDVVDEWPAPKQVHSFYFVKYRSYDDPKWKDKIDQAEKELQRKNQQRFQITEALKAKRSDRTRVNEQLRPLFTEMKQYNMVMNEKRNEIKPLQEALGSLRGANNVEREKGAGICSSEEELNNLIQSLHYRMQHESIPLTEEKQLIREIKQLEGTRENVIAYAAMRAKIQDSLGHKEAIQEQVKLIGTNLDGVRKERQAVSSKISYLDSEREDIENNIKALEAELKTVTQKRDEAFETLQQLRKQRDEGNACFYQNRSLLNSARELAAKKDIKTLEELSIAEVDKFMSLWCSSKAFRDDYEKRILPSLDVRQLSKDGRMRNPNEKPLAVMEPLRPTVTESVSEPKPKPPREDLKNTVKQDILPMQMIQKESTEKSVELKTASKHRAIEEETVVVENPEMFIAKDKEIDPTKLKEMKKEEEMAKQRQALERKKKLADKAAAKAAIRAQKEAEKKQMERERKLKKKEVAAFRLLSNQDEANGTEGKVVKPENSEEVEDAVETPVPGKLKEQKVTTTRSRKKTKGRDAVSKVILKRKKLTNYWVWAASAAAIVIVVLLLALLYNYLF